MSRAALSPVRRLTQTAETVTETGDLSQRIEVGGNDELSRLATSFNTMLAGLEESTRAQRQLVADASHELRTPLTSLRTNIEVLAGDRELPDADRSRLLSDVVEQLEEMTTLISELIELARAEQHVAAPEDVRLDLLVVEAAERVQRNHPGVQFALELEEAVVRGMPTTIERAIANLLDNAAKWSPPGATIEVRVDGGEVTVRDHGPGIADGAVQHGHGLGNMVDRVVAVGGTLEVGRSASGGTRIDGRVPIVPADAEAR